MDRPPTADLDRRTAPSWTTPSADGVELAAYELGGAGPPLLVAHATGFLGTMYGPLAAGLADRFRVVALDFRGHGSSTRPANDDFGWDRMALDVLAVAERLGPPRRSPGSATRWAAAPSCSPNASDPGRFARCSCTSRSCSLTTSSFDGPNPLAGPARSRRPSFPSRADALARYASRPPLGTMRSDVLELYVRDGFVDQPDGSVALACAPDDEARTFEAEAKVHTSTIASVGAAVTVAVGHDEEGPNPARFGAAIVAALANAELVVCPELGHLGPFDDPDAVAALVRAHLHA